jgi:ABC-type multidrug transport system fused ATPase/permease subunit
MKHQISVLKSVARVFGNLKRLLVLAWTTDPKLTFAYYATVSLSALGAVASSVVFKYFLDGLVSQTKNPFTSTIPLILVALLASRYFVQFFRNLTGGILNRTYVDYLFRYKLQNRINYDFYDKLSQLDIAQLEDSKIQDLVTKSKDTMTWRLPDSLRTFSYFFGHATTFFSSIIVLIPFGWWIAPLVILINLPFVYLRSKYGSIQWSIYGSGVPQVRKLWYLTWLLSERDAIKEMKIFQTRNILLDRLKTIQQYLYDLNAHPVSRYAKLLTVSDLVAGIILFVLALSQMPQVLAGAMTVGSFTLLIGLIDSLSSAVGAAAISFGDLYSDSLFVDHYFDVLNLPKTIHEKARPKIFSKITSPKVEFKNVSFAYPGGPKVLDNITFTIDPRQNVALVGENGAGKSTIIKLLCRFYDPTEGEILVNGTNLKNLNLDNWYKFLGTLFQNFVEYHFSIKDNITLGKTGTTNLSEMKNAAKLSGAESFISELPKKFDSILGREFEDGQELSTGQWQKLAIARAFYEQAPLLILDEPTSAIDAEAEFEIFNNLTREYKNKSLLLVSHRFSTVRNADKIW